MTPAPSSRLLRPCPDWGPRLGPTPTHGWCEADLLEQGGEGKPQASIRVAEDTAAGCGHWLQAESWACLPWQRAGDAVTASLTADRATLSVRGYEKGLEDLASGRIRGRIGHFCGLDSVFILKCPCFDIRYDCGMVLFLSWSTMVPCGLIWCSLKLLCSTADTMAWLWAPGQFPLLILSHKHISDSEIQAFALRCAFWTGVWVWGGQSGPAASTVTEGLVSIIRLPELPALGYKYPHHTSCRREGMYF